MPAPETKATENLNLNGTYHAAPGIQTADIAWMQRFAYFDKDQNSQYGTDKADKLYNGAKTYDGNFTDAEIAGNGIYTVLLDNADFSGEETISQLYVATDIPNNTKITFSDVSVNVNNEEVLKFDEAYLENEKPYLEGGMVFLAYNHWRGPLEKIVKEKGFTVEGNRIKLVKGAGNEKISITFQVSGFNYNQGEEPPQEPDYVTPPEKPDPEKGAVRKISGISYQITKSAKKNGTDMVKKDAGKQAKHSIPAAIKWNGYTFRVDSIGVSAFSKNKKVKSIVIGKNITSTGKNAFSGCTSLKTIDLSKNKVLKTVGKNAIKGVNSDCTIYAPKAKLAAYQKLFTRKGQLS
ncbi:hypothetical protein D7V86_11715 [bacterium D16-51]|nr:hypothetical protein D7V96_13570 [bacterium D16-59]RKI59681.1 hypothetical protein D7V86_11715 [bacterium D16-51]